MEHKAVDIFQFLKESEPADDVSIPNAIDKEQKRNAESDMRPMVEAPLCNGLLRNKKQALNDVFIMLADVFRASVLLGPPTKVKPLNVSVIADAKLVWIYVSNYSQDERMFLCWFLFILVKEDMADLSLSTAMACVPPVVPKLDSFKYRVIPESLPAYQFTVNEQFSMPRLNQKLTK